ncbi:uncharacterized protein [Elaeis guineensis]|uniref:uncharacterized protein isoform X5 n=1 Tax=Elaeis guineensis var. tenera TaxID=51953 RepID=UPI003C6D6858
MDFLSLPASFSPTNLATKPHKPSPPLFHSSRKPLPETAPPLSAAVRRPLNPTTIQTDPDPDPSNHRQNLPNPLSPKLWLSSKLSPPPPPPLPPPPLGEALENESRVGNSPSREANNDSLLPTTEFRQKGKIFVGNLPLWIKKNEIAEFFRQFGPVKSVVLIKGHDDPERNVGYCFVIYGGPTVEESAARAVEFDGMEFHGRILTVRLDDGRRLKARSEERARWVAGSDQREFRSKWHEERDNACRIFRKVLETQPENWQAVVSAFERLQKPSRREYGLMVNYYARRGDKHHARATFESMRARGVEPSSYVYTNLVHAYAVARDMQGALACIEEMKSEGIELTLVTYSILIGGFANVGDAKSADRLFKEAKQKITSMNAIIYSNIIYAHWTSCPQFQFQPQPFQTGNMARAEDLVREMEEEGIDAPIDLYHTMMDGYTNIRNEEKCLIVFERLKECGFTPSVISYGCLINLYTKMEKAIEVIDKMSLAGITPNEHTYTTVMQGYAADGDTGKAFEYFTKIKEKGLKLDVFTYEALLKACCKSGRMQSALAVTREMSAQKIPRNTFVYNILIDGWARRGDVWEAADLMQQMKQDGVLPDIHTYTSFINACCKAGDMQRATKMVEEMEAAGVKPNVKTYTTLIRGWAQASLPEKALRCFEEMKVAGLKPDKAAYHCLVTSLLSRVTVAEEYIYAGILGVCKEMVENDLIVDLGTAVHWSKRLRKIEITGGVLTEALQKTFPPAWNSHENSEIDSGQLRNHCSDDSNDDFSDGSEDDDE